MVKLFSYNMSWVNQAHDSQIEWNNAKLTDGNKDKITFTNDSLSESSSIMAKGAFLDEKNYEKLIKKYGHNFFKLRYDFFEKQLEDLKKIYEDYDFLSLVELLIHVPKSNHANYDEFIYPPKQYDLESIEYKKKNDEEFKDFGYPFKNDNYGIIKIMKELNLYDIDDNNSYIKNVEIESAYNIVYDNVINSNIPNGPETQNLSPFGEGIAIVFKNELLNRNNVFTWNQTETDFLKSFEIKEPDKYNIFINKINERKNKEKVHYYSCDLGPKFCGDEFITYRGTSDSGRSFIMTAGVQNNVLKILISFHGPNILNLIHIPTIIDYITNDEEGKKLKYTKNNNNSEFVNNGKPYYSNPLFQLKNVNKINPEIFKTIQEALLIKLQKTIQETINNGLNSILEKGISAEHCELYLGCDANDATGSFLEAIKKGITLNTTNIVLGNKEIKFNIVNEIKDTANIGKIEGLYTCCANADSLLSTIRKPDTPALGNFSKERFDITLDNKTYNPDFFKREKFGYNGDYVIFGTSTSDNNEYVIKPITDKFIYEENNQVMCSDHLPVEIVQLEKTTQSEPNYLKDTESSKTRKEQTSALFPKKLN